ncbi:MAG TPA: hypothetical protein V6C76_11505 [Drouetiella sp.]
MDKAKKPVDKPKVFIVDLARRIRDALWRDVNGRRGIKHEIAACEPQIQREIQSDWLKEIQSILEKEATAEVKGLGALIYSIELRDVFAAAALIGMSASRPGDWDDMTCLERATDCYSYADAMLMRRGERR